MRGGIAERGGVRVGHRIIEINGQSVVATAHEKIVQALSNSVGEVRKKSLHQESKIVEKMYVSVEKSVNTALKPPIQYIEFGTNKKQLTEFFLTTDDAHSLHF